MEGNRRNFLNKHSNPHFKKTAGPRKGKHYNSNYEEFSENFHSSDTVYRILCQSKKIGSVIGKGGTIVKALREETQAKITVSDSLPGSDERVIIIASPSEKKAKRQSTYNDVLEPHCAAQDALLKVHDRIVDEDLNGAEKSGSETVINARLLVSNNIVGCLLGRKGDVIQRLRSETGANMRVLPADHLPAFAMGNDELVQISGKPEIVKKALYEVSTLLHQNPRKDKPTLSHSTSYGSQEFHPSGPPMRTMLPPENPSWLERSIDIHMVQPMPSDKRYRCYPSALVHEYVDGVTPHDREAPSEFAIKILCSAERIGGVIGKGGSNVKQLEQETGACIHVENVSKESDERVIRVSSYEALWDKKSCTIDAILCLQNKTSEYSADGTVTTRLLVPSSKVGCILGQGGHVISEMRRRTHADIRVFSKKEKPKCASEDDELVQISGSFGIAKDALVEITSRLRTRYLCDANTTVETPSARPLPAFGPPENLRGGGLPLSSTTIVRRTERYEHIQDSVREFDSPSFLLPTRATGYLDFDDAKISSVSAIAGGCISEFAARRVRHQDPYSTGPDFGPSEYYTSSQYSYQRPTSSAGHNNYPPLGGYRGFDSEHGMYQNSNVSSVPYRSSDHRTSAYQNRYAQQDPYQSIRGHASCKY